MLTGRVLECCTAHGRVRLECGLDAFDVGWCRLETMIIFRDVVGGCDAAILASDRRGDAGGRGLRGAGGATGLSGDCREGGDGWDDTAVRPSVAAARATAEAGAADPSVLVAAEPMENFGVARYRLEDYAECVGGGGCYWADVDAQAKRAEVALDGLVAGRKAGEKLALVLDIDETSLSNYCEMKREDYGYLSQMFNAWEVSSEADMALPGR